MLQLSTARHLGTFWGAVAKVFEAVEGFEAGGGFEACELSAAGGRLEAMELDDASIPLVI